jgi:hypothetical protein
LQQRLRQASFPYASSACYVNFFFWEVKNWKPHNVRNRLFSKRYILQARLNRLHQAQVKSKRLFLFFFQEAYHFPA